MKILIVMSGGFDTYGPSRHLYDSLIEDLLNAGIEIHLIESHTTGIDPDIPQKFLDNKLFSFDIIKAKIAQKRQFIKRYLLGLKYTWKCRKPLKKAKGLYDIVFVQSCVWAPFLIPLCKKKTKSFVVWNIQDMFPGASIANGVLKNKFLINCFYKLHKRAYKCADYITVISEDMKDKVIEQGYPAHKIEIIYDWFDDKTVKEIEWKDNLFVREYHMSKNKFYVQYAGTMGFNFDYKVVLEVAKMLTNETDIEFQMVGFGSQYNKFRNEAEKLNLSNISFLPLQKQELVSHVYSACSVCLIPLPLNVIGNSVPSKAGLLMACKRPIITTSDKGSFYIKTMNENGYGYGFDTTDYKGVANAILFLKNNSNIRTSMGLRGYEFGNVIYSRTYNTNKYIELFKKIKAKN